MSKVEEITSALKDFSTEELQEIERAIISIYRQRRTGILYDDAYGSWTEQDQAEIVRQIQVGLDALDANKNKTINQVEKLISSWIRQ